MNFLEGEHSTLPIFLGIFGWAVESNGRETGIRLRLAVDEVVDVLI